MRFKALLIALLMLMPSAQAAHMDLRAFSTLPIMHEGRVKPMGHFASLLLQALSGKRHYKDMHADAWLAKVLFNPAWAERQPFFHVGNMLVINALTLPKRDDQNYSFDELSKAFIKHKSLIEALRREKTSDAREESLLLLFSHVTLFEQIKGGVTLLLPLKSDISPSQKLELQKWLALQGQFNEMLRVIPVAQGRDWQAPWQIALQDQGNMEAAKLMALWQQMARSYVDNRTHDFAQYSHALLRKTIAAAHDPTLAWRMPLENVYASTHLYFYSCLLYAASFIALFALRGTALTRTMTALLASGLVLHGVGIGLRMLILQRPPVSTLYESLIFVGLLAVACGFMLSWRLPRVPTLAGVSVLGVVLHLVGFGLTDEQDNLKVLQAVLDTKFWLATHVIVITLGYALTLLTGILAQVALYYAANKKLHAAVMRVGLWSLAFITTGTLLGGVWADQSWGRFWGWDPKENGAFLIILWIVWLLHAKVTGQIEWRGLLIGYAALTIFVALSWIGTNLLGVGLHSYGFISGVAGTLTAFVVFQSLIIFYLARRFDAAAL